MVLAQDTKKVCGEYIYYAPEHVSLKEARKTALQQARLKALADAFGTNVSQRNVTQIKTINEISDMQFYSLGESEVKGEWIEDIGSPKFEVEYTDSVLIVKAAVCGKAREILSHDIDFVVKILRNGTHERFEDDCFKDGDDLYLYFRSPTEGYLAIYLVDAEQRTYCLLPYRKDADGKVPLKANHEYVFFSKQKTDETFETSLVDRYVLHCEEEMEVNYLYVIFSPKPFVKANDFSKESEKGKRISPRELPFKKFQEWLTKKRVKDKDMKIEVRTITITK